MSNEISLLQRCMNRIKSVVFEKGEMIYLLHIPVLRRQQRRIRERWRPREDAVPVRVGFVIQTPQNWVVLRPLYEAAEGHPRIEPVAIPVPEIEKSFYLFVRNVRWEKMDRFASQTFGEDRVKTYEPGTGSWLNPESLNLDYVFIVRPYETYLPKMYSAHGLSRCAKVCYYPYATTMTDDDWPVEYNTHFIRNVSLIFADRPATMKYVRRKFHRTVGKGIQQAAFCGAPNLDGLEEHAGRESAVWPRKRTGEIFRIIWAPRWTVDPRMGGGHFFDYKDLLLALAEEDKGLDLLFRPHPLALEHYVAQGWITREEEDAYLERYARMENAAVDRTPEYYDTFFSSDVLITDFSSMVFAYFFTGKPIIYCACTLDHLMNEEGLMDSMYIAESFGDIRRYLDMFRRGEDPKRELREEMANRFRTNGKASEAFLEKILQDYDRERKA